MLVIYDRRAHLARTLARQREALSEKLVRHEQQIAELESDNPNPHQAAQIATQKDARDRCVEDMAILAEAIAAVETRGAAPIVSANPDRLRQLVIQRADVAARVEAADVLLKQLRPGNLNFATQQERARRALERDKPQLAAIDAEIATLRPTADPQAAEAAVEGDRVTRERRAVEAHKELGEIALRLDEGGASELDHTRFLALLRELRGLKFVGQSDELLQRVIRSMRGLEAGPVGWRRLTFAKCVQAWVRVPSLTADAA